MKREGILSLWNGNLTSVLHRFPYSAINFAVFEATNDILTKITHNHDTPSNRFAAGALSGAAACFVCYPLDLVRTRLTVSNSFSTSHEGGIRKGSKIYHLVKDIVLREGVAGLYRGLPVSLFVTAPTLAISFSIYGYIKGHLISIGGVFTHPAHEHSSSSGKPVLHLSAIGSLCAGCMSGIASSCAIFPVDVVRKRMQVMGQLMPLNTTTAAVAAEVSGAVPSAEAALHLTVDTVEAKTVSSSSNSKVAVMADTVHNTKPTPPLLPHAQAAQQCAEHPPLHSGTTTIQQARHILRTEGVRGFYRGIAPELLKVCPMVAIMYCSYEMVQEALNDHFPSP